MNWQLTFETYAVGDECWIWVGDHQGKGSQGKVIAVLDLPGYSEPHYVIAVPTGIDDLLEIRSGNCLEMSRTPR